MAEVNNKNGKDIAGILTNVAKTIKGISEGISKMINLTRPTPAMLPTALLLCTALKRPGLSALTIASRVIAKQESEGLAFGPMPDGTQNGYETFIKILVEEIVHAIKFESRGDVVIPAGALVSQGMVATSNGTFPVVVTNLIGGGHNIQR